MLMLTSYAEPEQLSPTADKSNQSGSIQAMWSAVISTSESREQNARVILSHLFETSALPLVSIKDQNRSSKDEKLSPLFIRAKIIENEQSEMFQDDSHFCTDFSRESSRRLVRACQAIILCLCKTNSARVAVGEVSTFSEAGVVFSVLSTFLYEQQVIIYF